MYCPNCGEEVKKGYQFCTNCGYELEKKEPLTTNTSDNSTLLGVLSCIFCAFPLLSIPLAIISITTSKKNNNENKKMKPGFILGIISLIISTIQIIIGILIFLLITNISYNSLDDYKIEDNIENWKKYDEKIDEINNIKGYSWISDDKSVLYLNYNNDYRWYEKDMDESNYYEGTYQLYNKESAIKYLEEQFGIEENTLFDNIEKEKNNFYVIVLTCNKTVLKGETTLNNSTVYYYGYYHNKNHELNLKDIKTSKSINFIRKEKLNNIDV